jgi:hypothetical protein
MMKRARGSRRGTHVRFALEGARRIVTVDGSDLPEVERRRLERLLRALPIDRGTVVLRRDWTGRRRLSFSSEIPEHLHQVIRNIVGNLAALRLS